MAGWKSANNQDHFCHNVWGVEMPKPTDDLSHERKAENLVSQGDSQSTSFFNRYRGLIITLATIAICLFFFVPTIMILLSDVFPNAISESGAAKSLSDGVNKAVAVISVLLGCISIFLARKTDKVFEAQKAQQNNFMEHIEVYTQNMNQKIDKLLYDKTSDMAGKKIKSFSEANEDDMKPFVGGAESSSDDK